MTPTLSALLCLGLCLSQRTRTQADRPILRADKGPVVPLGRSVTLRCRGSQGAEVYRLQKEGPWKGPIRGAIQDVKPSGREAQFLIPSVTAKDAGIYSCLYRHSSHWSVASAPLYLRVTGLHDPPSLSALPSSQVTPGQQVTLQCQSQVGFNWFALYKDGEQIGSRMVQSQGRGSQATFSIPAGTPAHGGTYRCYTFHSINPYEWSAPSDPLVLRVTGPDTTKDPHLPQSPGDPQALTSSPPGVFSPIPESENTLFGPVPQDYTLGNLIRLSLAGLVLIILVVLLTEAWQSWREL
ncbi:platelet glycoprotein VI-like [Macrotis lagotis]|uniref:platelet glycoprotein VI-like n=1 Tax=Macrotis lagotis TaxID=92651 RepID=UPI003D681783